MISAMFLTLGFFASLSCNIVFVNLVSILTCFSSIRILSKPFNRTNYASLHDRNFLRISNAM